MTRMNPTLSALALTNCHIPCDIFEGGTLQIYSGRQPDNPVIATGTLLAQTVHLRWQQRDEITIVSQSNEVNVTGTGTAGWYRIISWDGFYNITGSCGTAGADLNMSNIHLIIGQNVYFMNFTLVWEWGFGKRVSRKIPKQDVPNEGIYFEEIE